MARPQNVYDTTFFVNDRWNRIEVRPDDIVIATPYKAGTTWMQNICLHLVFQDLEVRHIGGHSPWIEMRFNDFDEIKKMLDGQTHRRVIKSHIAFDGIRYEPDMKYIFVGRDPRDIFMSLWNFYTAFGDHMFAPIDNPNVADLPRPPEDILTFWDDWISRGAFEGETDGYPFWSCLRQTQTWWDEQHRDNILLVHYADMLADLRGQIARVADFLGIEVEETTLDGITELCTFASMKANAARLDKSAEENLKGGANTFFNKGTNKRWMGLLDDARLAAYDKVAAARLSPECRAWVER